MTSRCRFSSRCCFHPFSAVPYDKFSVPSTSVECNGHILRPLFRYRRKPAVEHSQPASFMRRIFFMCKQLSCLIQGFFFSQTCIFLPWRLLSQIGIPYPWDFFDGFSELCHKSPHNRLIRHKFH